MKNMTKQEFLSFLQENLFPWLSDRNRPLEAHLLGVEEWVTAEFNRAVKESDKEKIAMKKAEEAAKKSFPVYLKRDIEDIEGVSVIRRAVLREDGIHFIERDGKERQYAEYPSIEKMNDTLRKMGFGHFEIDSNPPKRKNRD